MSVAKPLRCAKSYCFDSRCAIAITTAELGAGLQLAGSASRPVDVLPIALRDIALSFGESGERMVEHVVAIVLLTMILRAQKVIVVVAMDKFAKESRGCPFGPRAAPGGSAWIDIGVGQ